MWGKVRWLGDTTYIHIRSFIVIVVETGQVISKLDMDEMQIISLYKKHTDVVSSQIYNFLSTYVCTYICAIMCIDKVRLIKVSV